MPTISVEDNISLERPFTEEEVKYVIWQFGRNKAPGPDGFMMEFFKHTWDIIKSDLMLVVKEFESTYSLDWRLSCTNLKLISKCSGAASLHNFRPISLIGGVYKIISKLLAERFKLVLLFMIGRLMMVF